MQHEGVDVEQTQPMLKRRQLGVNIARRGHY